ncbi:hypothetical protein [Nonomuraea sp. NPDC046570]|uniref:hypothetical protein n=1 Tax=Nonomuraea sp. NPDC046570 TaxID=3155255 RepID=UPI0033D8AF97
MTQARTKIDVAKAAHLYEQGWRLRPLARHLGCSFQRLSVHLRLAGVQMRTPASPRAFRLPVGERRDAIVAAVRAGKPVQRIVKEHRTTSRSVRLVAEQAGLHVPAPRGRLDRAEVQRLFKEEKLSRREIAERTGFGYGTVASALRELGLAHYPS